MCTAIGVYELQKSVLHILLLRGNTCMWTVDCKNAPIMQQARLYDIIK